MFELKGKYNTAKIFTDNCDSETQAQLTNLLNQASISGSSIRIMPDCHAGKGCVVGTTMTLTDRVIPNLVGVDIGCGMLAIKLKETSIDFTNLDSIINKYIPSGFDIHTNQIGVSNAERIKAPIDYNKSQLSLGTLGGGNHFIEVDVDRDNSLWLVIHSGSRHLGIEVCDYYQDLAYNKLKNEASGGDIKTLRKELIDRLTKEGRQKELSKELKKLNDKYKQTNVEVPHELAYVTGQDFEDYIHDMQITQEHAYINRSTMAKIILDKAKLHEVDRFDTIHNYIDTKNMILRKGSISAQHGERVLIPMNMRDGSLICIGKGNPDWNYSAPHGAGRIMSRSQAKDNVAMKDFRQSMQGIFTTSVCESTVDEAPMVYKPMYEIIENIKDTVDVIDIIKPVYNFKAH